MAIGTMSKLVIFCENYTIIDITLYLATRNYHDRPVTIVFPSSHDLFELFQAFNEKVFHGEVNLIYFEPYPYLLRMVKARGISKIFRVIPNIIRERRYLKEVWNKHFAELEGCEVFFFSRGFSGLKFYLLKKLSKRNRLVYIAPKGPPDMSQYTPTNVLDLAKLTIFKLIYGCDVAVGKVSFMKGFPWIPDRFVEKKVDRVIDGAERDEMIKGFDLSQFRVFATGGYSVIYFDDSLIEVGCLSDVDTFKRELAGIFGLLVKYFPEKEIAHKYHPGYSGDKTLIEVGDMLPSFIPAELLYDDNVQMYLSIFSRSIAHVEKGLAVSIADLISFKSDEIRNTIKEELIEVSKSKILFPKSLDELERILTNIVKGGGISRLK